MLICRSQGEKDMPLSADEFLQVRQMLHESFALESLCPLGETKYGEYTAVIESHFEGYVYEVEGAVEPIRDQLQVIMRCDAFPFSSKDDAEAFLDALGEKGSPIFANASVLIEYAWGYLHCEGYYFPRLSFVIKHASKMAQSELIEALRLARVRFDDVLSIFELASMGSIAVLIAKERIALACGASIGGHLH
jgi:hypothetical protein